MTTSTMKRYGIPAMLVAGGVTVGALFAPIGLASADDTDDTDDTDSTDSTDRTDSTDSTDGTGGEQDSNASTDDSERRSRWRGRFGARIDAITESLGLSAEAVGDGLDAGKSLADLAGEQGVPVEQLQADLVAAANAEIDEAVAEGVLSEERAEQIRADLDERIAAMIERTPRDGGPPWRGRGVRAHRLGAQLEELSEVLGLSEEEIRSELAGGTSLAELGERQGVSAEELADVLVAGAMERIDEAVADGRLTEEEAAEAREHVESHADHAVTREHHGRPGRPGRHGHFGGGHGEPPSGDTETETDTGSENDGAGDGSTEDTSF